MKKIVTSFLLLCIYSAALAQTDNPIVLGANVGYNLADVIAPGASLHSRITSGYNAGISADFYLSYDWSIATKLIYDQKGWGNGYLYESVNGPNSSSTVGYTNLNYKLNYVTLPVMAGWHFGKTRNWYVNAGLYTGFLLNATATGNSAPLNSNVKSYFNRGDFGLALGIGVRIPVSDNLKLFIEDDGQGSLINVFKENSDHSFQNIRSGLNVGLNFSL